MGQDDWRRLITEIRDWLGPVDLVLTGGEALLKPFTIELTGYASSIGLKVELLTHGYWKDQSLLERLASARPRRITLSLDGVGHTHDQIRGRPGFFERTQSSIDTLLRARKTHSLDYEILLKTVVMDANLQELGKVARYATERGIDVLYQPIEQNYGEPHDPGWTRTSSNWPGNLELATRAIDELIQLKRGGAGIRNSEADLERMAIYFAEPDRYRVRIQNHDFSGRCSASGSLQVQPNGDVLNCFSAPSIGNVRNSRLRRIWQARPARWQTGCCMAERMSPEEWADTHP